MKDRTSLPDALRLNDVPFNGRKLRVSRAKKHTATPGAGPKNPQQQSKDKTKVLTADTNSLISIYVLSKTTSQPKSFQGVYAQKGIVPHIPSQSKRNKKAKSKAKKGGKKQKSS